MKITVEINEAEIYKMLANGKTEEDIAEEVRERVVNIATQKLSPVISNRITKEFPKSKMDKEIKTIVSNILKERIIKTIREFSKSEIEDIAQNCVYQYVGDALETKTISVKI